MFEHVGGANQPDFVGLKGSPAAGHLFDVTTVGREVRGHYKRFYGENMVVGGYANPYKKQVVKKK
jgi:hypothetical protein